MAWKEVKGFKPKPNVSVLKTVLPQEFKIFEFNYANFIRDLLHVPNRDNFKGISDVIVSLPSSNGVMEKYRIVEASSFEPELQAKYPEIRSFAGQGVTNPSNSIRFAVSPNTGISVTIRSASDETTFIIDPFTNDYKNFIVFDNKFSHSDPNFKCSTDDSSVKEFGPDFNKNANVVLNNADDGTLRRCQVSQGC